MNKRSIAAITGGVWLAAIALAVADGVALNHPVALRGFAGSSPSKVSLTSELQQPSDETVESSVLEVPPMVIVGDVRPSSSARGVAEMQGPMQGPYRVTIGPGVVTYPEESFAKSDGDRIRR